MTAPASSCAIYTIGHSTHPAEQFLALLNAHGIRRLADVRTVPRSRRHPHFSREALDAFLHEHGVVYRHFAALGGLRKPRADSVNTGWRHPGFRGYADHMQTAEFRQGIEELVTFAGGQPTSVMCAEAVWWHCHRQLVADALLARGIEVRHIMSEKSAPSHVLTDFAKICGGKVSYRGLL